MTTSLHFAPVKNRNLVRNFTEKKIIIGPQIFRIPILLLATTESGDCAHTAVDTKNFLHLFIDNRIISRGLWLYVVPTCCRVTILLCGSAEDKVFAQSPQSIKQLKGKITAAVNEIGRPMS